RISVRQVNGHGEFYDTSSGNTFVPRGNNYIQLHDQQTIEQNVTVLSHSTFNIGLYDAAKAEASLARMQADGYNLVRVWVNGCCVGTVADPAGGLSAAYLANVIDFMTRAKAHGVFVMFTIDDPPKTPEYEALFFSSCCAFFGGE